jgi:hypothetical protein
VALAVVPGVTRIAQGQTASLEPGTRLRVTVPCEITARPTAGADRAECRSEGSLVLVRADTVTLDVAGSTTRYGLGAVSRVDVSRGHRSYWLVGAGAGLVVGTGVTFAVLNSGGSTSLCNQSENQDAMSSGACLGLTALGGLAGVGLGALIGGLVRSERWEELPLERLRVSLRPPSGGSLGLTLAVAF